MTDDLDQSAQRAKRESARFLGQRLITDQLEPAASHPAAIDPQAIALSTAISLRRIADALEPQNHPSAPSVSSTDIRKVLDNVQQRLGDIDIESVAGDALNITKAEVEATSTDDALRLIRALAFRSTALASK